LSTVFKIAEYLNYYLRAKTIYSAHSPFVYDFINSVLDTSKVYYAFQTIDQIRILNERDGREIEITDLGAGSHTNNSRTKTIKSIANSAVSTKWQGKILFNLMQHYKPKHVLELGTSLGISSLYLALGNLGSSVITIEGDPNVASIARENFKRAKVENVLLKIGNFDDILPELLASQQIDLSFLDGNHTEEATIRYFDLVASQASNNSIVILDDIHWSKGMQSAWDYARKNTKYKLSIDLYYFGILIQDERLIEKLDISLIDKKLKPFSKGVFG